MAQDTYVTVCFEEDGPLGLGLAARDVHSAPIVTELAPGSQASRQPMLKAGMVLFAVNGNEVKGLGFDQIMHQIKFTPRPAALTFIVPTSHQPRPATAHPAAMPERSTPDIPPRVALPSTPGHLSAESEDLGESYLCGSPGLELQVSSPPTRQGRSTSARSGESAVASAGATQAGSPADGRVRVSAVNSASAQGDVAVFRQKIEGAAKVVAPLSQRTESARVAFIAARAALDELHLSKSMLSQQLMYLMTHSEGASSASEISELQQRIEEQGRALTSASRRHEEAEFALRCAISVSVRLFSGVTFCLCIATGKRRTILRTRSPGSDCCTTSLKRLWKARYALRTVCTTLYDNYLIDALIGRRVWLAGLP